MKLLVQLALVCVLATLLIACDSNKGTDETPPTTATTMEPTTAADTQRPLPAPGQFTIDLTPGNVSVRANQVNELEILEGIAAAASIELLTGNIAWQTVTVDIHEDSLHVALVALIKGYPYQIVYTPDEATRQEVLSELVISERLPPVATTGAGEVAADSDTPPDEDEDEEDGQPDAETLAQLQALQSESAEIRAAAAANIEPTGAGLYALTELISSDPSPEVRIASSQALEFSDDPLAIQALVDCLKDEYPAVLLECITALEHIGDASTAPLLQPMLEHYDAAVRNTAAQAIENLQ